MLVKMFQLVVSAAGFVVLNLRVETLHYLLQYLVKLEPIKLKMSLAE